jgi:hypothetical protein
MIVGPLIEKEGSAYRIQEIHGLVFMDGEVSPLTGRCCLDKDQHAELQISCLLTGLRTRVKEPAVRREASIIARERGSGEKDDLTRFGVT